jgi:hypothetical protein
MKAFRAGAIVVSIGILIAVVGTSVSTQPGRFSPECRKIKEIGAQLKRIKARRDRITIGNKAGWCPLKKQQINYDEQMIRIFDSDPQKCGVRDSVVDRLRAATERLRASTQAACGA